VIKALSGIELVRSAALALESFGMPFFLSVRIRTPVALLGIRSNSCSNAMPVHGSQSVMLEFRSRLDGPGRDRGSSTYAQERKDPIEGRRIA
jgi:hypothetical protein